MLIESVVAILLLLTIGYCVLLNRRLLRFKADEHSLKGTISELITATEIAERAIAGLKVTVRECDKGLGEQLRAAESCSTQIARQIDAGEQILQRLKQIVMAARPTSVEPPAVAPLILDAKATAADAQAFATRTRLRSRGEAA